MPGRIEFVILRTGRSPPATPHHASLRRSYSWLQAGERLPEEDSHLSDHLSFQAYECAGLAAHFKEAPSLSVPYAIDDRRGVAHNVRRCL
jgi:hypothetical protein